MPSVFTLTGPDTGRCNWVIGKGRIGRRKFRGCFDSYPTAERAAFEAGRGWEPVAARPPGVPMQGLRRRRKSRRRRRR
jgi:hypothetical protein